MQKYGHGRLPGAARVLVFYEFEYALRRAGAIIMAGTRNPIFRRLGLQAAPA
jgi:hypothetical protein